MARDLVTIIPPAEGDGIYSGHEEIRGRYETMVAAKGQGTTDNCQVEGENVTCRDTYTDEGLKGIGVDFIEGQYAAVVRDGKIQSYTFTISPESLAKFPAPEPAESLAESVSDLLGVWWFPQAAMMIEFKEDGTYRVFSGSAAIGQIDEGPYTFDAGKITAIGCNDQPATYEAYLTVQEDAPTKLRMQVGSWHTFIWQASDELFAPIRHFLIWMAVFSLVAVGLMTSLGYLAAKRIVTPVRRLQAAAQLVGRGELQQPIAIQTGDEIQDLADEFNRMNRQLEAAFAGLTDQVAIKTQQVESLLHSTDEILDAVPTPIIMVNKDEQVQYINRVGRDSFQAPDDTTESIPLFEILPVDASLREHLQKEFRGARNGGTVETASGTEDTAASTAPVIRWHLRRGWRNQTIARRFRSAPDDITISGFTW